MGNTEKLNTYKQALKTYGLNAQLTIAIEEMAELTKILCKKINGRYPNTPYNRVSLVDEVADVSIMLDQIILGLKIDSFEVESRIDYKVGRLESNLAELEAKKKTAKKNKKVKK